MRRTVIIIGIVLIAGLFLFELNRNYSGDGGNAPSDEYTDDNAVLAIRGFRHDQLLVSGGRTVKYEVGAGEEFKVLAIVHILDKDGSFSWKGPEGVGEGSISLKAPGEEISELKVFNSAVPGTAELILSVPRQDGQTEENKIIVDIK